MSELPTIFIRLNTLIIHEETEAKQFQNLFRQVEIPAAQAEFNYTILLALSTLSAYNSVVTGEVIKELMKETQGTNDQRVHRLALLGISWIFQQDAECYQETQYWIEHLLRSITFTSPGMETASIIIEQCPPLSSTLEMLEEKMGQVFLTLKTPNDTQEMPAITEADLVRKMKEESCTSHEQLRKRTA